MGQIAYAFRVEMSRALFASYLSVLRSGECETQFEAIDMARKSPAPHFFTSAQNCAKVVAKMLRGEPTGLKNPDKIRKFEELRARLEKYMEVNPEEVEKYGLPTICEEIVNQPAPEFYICHNTAKQIILKQRKRQREEVMRW
jgi:hypothetical protein